LITNAIEKTTEGLLLSLCSTLRHFRKIYFRGKTFFSLEKIFLFALSAHLLFMWSYSPNKKSSPLAARRSPLAARRSPLAAR